MHVTQQPVRMHGVELAERLLEMKPEARVLLLSVCTDDELNALGMKRPPWPLLRKPIKPERFIEGVFDALAGKPIELPPKLSEQTHGRGIQWSG